MELESLEGDRDRKSKKEKERDREREKVSFLTSVLQASSTVDFTPVPSSYAAKAGSPTLAVPRNAIRQTSSPVLRGSKYSLGSPCQ